MVTVNTVVSLCLLIGFNLLWDYFRDRRDAAKKSRAERLHQGLNALCNSDTVVVSVMKCESAVAVCVIDEWTQFSEQCFIQGSLEEAVEDALRSRMTATTKGE